VRTDGCRTRVIDLSDAFVRINQTQRNEFYNIRYACVRRQCETLQSYCLRQLRVGKHLVRPTKRSGQWKSFARLVRFPKPSERIEIEIGLKVFNIYEPRYDLVPSRCSDFVVTTSHEYLCNSKIPRDDLKTVTFPHFPIRLLHFIMIIMIMIIISTRSI